MSTVVTTASSGPYAAVASTTFAVNFQSLSADEIEVTLDGVVVAPADWVFTRDADGTGEVVLDAPVTGEVIIQSKPSYDFQIEFERHGGFYPDQINPGFDRLARLIIALKNSISWLIPSLGTVTDGITASITPRLSGLQLFWDFVLPRGEAGPTGTVEASGLVFVTPQQYGAVADGVTDDGPAFAAAIAALKAMASNDQTIYKGSPKLHIPAGNYFLGTTTLDITHTLIVEGEGSGLAGGIATRLRWAAGATGIRIQRYNTSGATAVDGVQHYGGDATQIRGLYMEGAYTGFASEGAFHAIHAKARFVGQDIFCRSWQGDAFHIVADAGAGVPKEGNANCFQLIRCTSWYCQNGCYIDGDDANAGTIEHCDFSYSREFGYWDTSALGNTVIGCHFEANGIHNDPAAPKAIASYLGNAFRVVEGQEVWASTNAPPATQTNNQGWLFYIAGGPIADIRPAWVTGMTWRAGGAAYTYGPSSTVNWISNYFEGGQADGQLNTAGHLIVQTGTPDPRYKGGIAANVNGITVTGQLNVLSPTTLSAGQHYTGVAGGGVVSDLSLYFRHTNNYAFMYFESYLPDGTGYSLDATIFSQRAGGVVYETLTHDFRRTGGGSYFKIDFNGVKVMKDGKKLGYAAGTGGAVTQTTSKSTSVDLTKTNGQITMHNASLAAATSVSFTVNNGLVATTDTIIVNIASGATAGAYMVVVDAVGAGTFRITLRNNSAGALAEAVVLNYSIITAAAT